MKRIFLFGVAFACPWIAFGDQKINDDLLVAGSVCVGFDCVSGENFAFDTIRLKENNLRIRFIDTSSTLSFPTRDWEIVANDNANGGLNRFSIANVDANTTPFTIIDGAPSDSLYVRDNGYVGFGTSAPMVNLHAVAANSPTLRLEQTTGAGFAAQSWDILGNETNFAIRDVSDNSKLPFRIRAGAPNASLFIDSDGDVGLETTTPDGQFDVAHFSDSNNHAFLISPTSYVGVNIDNGFLPNGLFDVQTGGGSKFTVASDGDVGLKTTAPTANLEIFDATQSQPGLKISRSSTHNTSFTTGKITTTNSGGGIWEMDMGEASASEFRITYNGSVVLTVTSGGDVIAAGGLADGSDRNRKENFKSVDTAEILEKLASMPVSHWNYKGDTVTHLGPMAQDFWARFNVGRGVKGIGKIDADGVAIASIQELYKQLKSKDRELEQLREQNGALETRLERIEALLLKNTQ